MFSEYFIGKDSVHNYIHNSIYYINKFVVLKEISNYFRSPSVQDLET